MAHIPLLHTISEFFEVYGLGQPLHSHIMCMRLEEQPDTKLMAMPLYRSAFFRVIQFTNSSLTYTAQGKIPVLADCLSFSYPGKLESWEREGRLYGTVIYFSDAFAELDPTHSGFASEYPYFTSEGDVLLPLDQSHSHQLKELADEMITEMYADQADKLSMVRKLLAVYLHKIRRLHEQQIGALPPDSKANQALFSRFRKVTDEYFGQLALGAQTLMPSVATLAGLLAVSPNYLNEVIKTLSGQTASAYLQRKMILEIKSYLLHTDLQVAQIAYQLGFENVPYFNRFFKKHTRLTPSEFRTSFHR